MGVPQLSSQAFQQGASNRDGDNGLGNDGGRAGGKEADKGDVSIGGKDGGKFGAGDAGGNVGGHDGNAGAQDGGRVAHREKLMGDIDVGCGGDSGAFHANGMEASRESLIDGACIGGGGGPFASIVLPGIALAWPPSAGAAFLEARKVAGKIGAWAGGGGGPISTA